MISDAVEEVGKFFIRVIVETVFFYTGEIALYLVTFGRKKVRWDFYQDDHPIGWAVLSDASTLLGFLLWLFLIGFAARALLADGMGVLRTFPPW